MRVQYLKFTILFCIGLLSACVDKANFTHIEREWLNVYQKNDTLIFQELNSLQKDTSIITKKEIYHDDYDWFRHDGTVIQIGYIRYKNKMNIHLNGNAKMIEMYKRKKDKPSFPVIIYLGSSFFMANSDLKLYKTSLDLVPMQFEEVYIFEKKSRKYITESNSYMPQTLYWDKSYGIIKYVTYGGKVWERINWE